MTSLKRRANFHSRRHFGLRKGLVCAIFAFSILPLVVTLAGLPKIQSIKLHLPFASKYAVLEKWYLDHVEPVQELRPLVVFPDSWEGRWFDFDKNYVRFEKWFGDHVGLRDLIIRGKNELDYRLFGSSTRVYFGKDDDIYGRGMIDGQLPAMEAVVDSAEKINAVARGLVSYTEQLKAMGVTSVVIAPMQKENFFPGRLPFFAPKLPASSNFMAMYRVLESNPKLHFVDVFDTVKALQNRYPIFYRQDFHWTDMAALAVAKNTTNMIASMEHSPTKWEHPAEIEYKPYVGSDERFSARLMPHEILEPALIKTWKDVHTRTQFSTEQTEQTGIEFETDMVGDSSLLPPTCLFGNSFSDGMERAGLPDYFQKFTRLSRYLTLQQIPGVIKDRGCKYLIIQILDISPGYWASLKQ
jgi:hypothetical protein